MLFNSLEYAIFLPIVFCVYWALPHKYRWPLLLVASYYFYMSWNPKYVVLILLTTAVSYGAARLLEKTESNTAKKWILSVALIVSLGVLFIFKYFNFFSASVAAMLGLFSLQLSPVTLKLVLPVGISFYTFQTLSYVIDVYRGKVKAEKNFGIYATFISFFPQLVAGPIERTSNLLPQIKSEKTFDYHKATYGMKLMTWGFFKKLVIADVISVYVDRVYSSLDTCTGFDLAIGIFFFTIQIYCDFSGYSDIAIGTANLLGIDLMTNFRSPYFAKSVKEFWSRWHISLSTWFKDYVYIPLGGNRCSKLKHYRNVLITFLVSGLWHGASWTFVIWGALHGLVQILENAFTGGRASKRDNLENGISKQNISKIEDKKNSSNNKAVDIIRMALTFIFCNIAWVFFRADSFSDALLVLSRFFGSFTHPSSFMGQSIDLERVKFIRIMLCIALLGAYDCASYKADVIEKISAKPAVIRYGFYFALVTIILLFRSNGGASFVYFQF